MKRKLLQRKEKAFVQSIIDNPKATNDIHVIRAGYDVKSKTVAGVMGSQLLSRPHIQSALSNYVELTESAMTNTVRDWKDSDTPRKREIAMQNAQYIHDKIFGRSTQKIEQTTTGITLTIDLTSSIKE